MLPHLNGRFFENVRAEDRKRIVAAAKTQEYHRNAVLAYQGEAADRIFLLVKGHGRHFFTTERGERVVLRWVSAGDVIGAIAFLSRPSPYQVSTEVVKGSRALIWDRKTLHRLVIEFPQLLQNAMQIASDYLEWYLTAQIALTCQTGRERFASVLKLIAQTVGHKTPSGIEIQVSNEDLANAAAITVFEVSRLISEWKRNGLVEKRRGKLILHSLDLA